MCSAWKTKQVYFPPFFYGAQLTYVLRDCHMQCSLEFVLLNNISLLCWLMITLTLWVKLLPLEHIFQSVNADFSFVLRLLFLFSNNNCVSDKSHCLPDCLWTKLHFRFWEANTHSAWPVSKGCWIQVNRF